MSYLDIVPSAPDLEPACPLGCVLLGKTDGSFHRRPQSDLGTRVPDLNGGEDVVRILDQRRRLLT